LQPSKEADFFQENSVIETNKSNVNKIRVDYTSETIEDKSHEGPNVNASVCLLSDTTNNNDNNTKLESIKSNIIQTKKPAAKKGGLGAKKVNTDFNAIEKQMEEKERLKQEEIVQEKLNKEETERVLEKQMASMKLAYDNLDKQREKEEAKLKQFDPKKAQQLERLGMAAGNRSNTISHSALTDMQIIQQDGVTNTKPTMPRSRDFFDDFDNTGFMSKSNGSKFGIDDMDLRGFGSNNNSSSSKINEDWTIIDDKFESNQPKSSFKRY
jgi:ADP-ribosylation factor GTPase-activating protein 2/3